MGQVMINRRTGDRSLHITNGGYIWPIYVSKYTHYIWQVFKCLITMVGRRNPLLYNMSNLFMVRRISLRIQSHVTLNNQVLTSKSRRSCSEANVYHNIAHACGASAQAIEYLPGNGISTNIPEYETRHWYGMIFCYTLYVSMYTSCGHFY